MQKHQSNFNIWRCNIMGKTYSQTYLYRKYSEYDKKLFKFIMQADRIDTKSEAFADVAYDIKRRSISEALNKILTSDNVIFGIDHGNTLPKAFKVFVASDVKMDKNKSKVFIDVTECVKLQNGVYKCNNVEWIISYLVNAMTSYIYAMATNKIVSNNSIIRDGGEAFAMCFTYIIDRLYKISTVQSLRKKVQYISAMYYQINLLGRDYSKNFEAIKSMAMKISGIEIRDAKLIDLMIEENCFLNLNTFVENLNRIFKFKDLSVDLIVDKWFQSFGTGTIFALEFFPAFSAMLTNTYVGGYIDQQLTIEKVTGDSMVRFTKSVLQIGGAVV